MFFKWSETAQKKRSPRPRPRPLKESQIHNSIWFDKNPGNFYLVKHQHQHQEGPIENSGTHRFFPEELVEEILSRLPLKSLLRFSCVCKSWYHLIYYCQRFASLHINNFKTSHLLLGTCTDLCEVGFTFFLPSNPPAGVYFAGVYCDYDYIASPTFVELCRPLLAGSCNGVLCLYQQRADDTVLWNPATKNMKIVPKSNIPRNVGVDDKYTLGFGFDPKTNDYKVLQMVYDMECILPIYPTPPVIHFELYSLRKNSWRKVDSSHDFFFRTNRMGHDLVCNLPFTDNRVTCALVMGINRPTKWEIFLFDMSTEMIDTIPIPSSMEAQLDGDGHLCFTKIFPFKESLTIGISHICVGRKRLFDVWVLNDFYSKESRSWSNLFSGEHGVGSIPKIIGGWENSILYQNFRSGKLGRFDLGTREFTETISWPWRGHSVTSTIFRESIVRVGEMKEIQVDKRSCRVGEMKEIQLGLGKRPRKEGNELHQEGKRSCN